jgi:hypothetical protein
MEEKDPYDFETICTLCTCVEKTHAIFWKCPILDNNPICGECCQVGCLKNNIAGKFSKALGKDISLEDINKACTDCGRNYAKQNEELAKQLERESL